MYFGQTKELFLSDVQISLLGKSRVHYYLFLILSLKNQKLKYDDLVQQFTGFDIAAPLKDLMQYKILMENNDFIYVCGEMVRMPAANTELIKKFYALFDSWDQEFSKLFKLNPVLDKTFIKRVKTSELENIQKQIDALIHAARTTKETDSEDESVFFLRINYSHKSTK